MTFEMRIAKSAVALCLVFLLLPATRPVAGETDQAQPYEEVRYPTFKDGRLQSLLIAKQAEAYDIAEGTPRVNLSNVVITMYDLSEESLARTPDNQPLPVKMTVTSDRGYFTRRPPEPGAQPEEIANLEGNVVLRQMRVGPAPARQPGQRPSRLAPGVDTEIRCEHAQWNNTLRKLNSDGEVELLQEDSRITGTGFLYLADDDALQADSDSASIKDWGGIVFIEHNARMEIDRDGAVRMEPTAAAPTPGAIGRTIITCRDTASYKLREREIQFEREVKISREGLVIESDILKVFLRREDEMEAAAQNPAAPAAPGQVKNIVATIGKRPGSVVITGYNRDETTGEEIVQYTAKGGRADFDYDNNRITLTDTRDQRWPEVEFGADRDRITDGTLVFVFVQVRPESQSTLRPAREAMETVLDSLTTFGGRGEVVLRSRRREDTGPTVPTIVKYRGDMNYNRVEGRIRFQSEVNLRRGDLAIQSELLDIRLSSDGTSVEPNQVNRIFAETDVDIRTGIYHATAHRAEYEVYTGSIGAVGAGLDTLRLFSPGGSSPANPRIRDQKGNQINAPEIHMQRLYTEAGQRDQHLLVARGSSTCDFVTGQTVVNNVARERVVSIHCERGMEYNQANKRARFEGSVNATSDIPEDSYVLTSDRLVVDFEESPRPEEPEEVDTWFRRITAEGNARLVQDNRVCEATNIIRDFPTQDPKQGDIYLQGSAASGDGMPPQMAVLREEDAGKNVGAMFVAPLIKSSSMGELIQANGPGQLSMPDVVPEGMNPRDFRSEILFTGAASYESIQAGAASDARFWGGVTMRQPSRNVQVTADEMDARFIQEEGAGDFGGTRIDLELERVGRLRRVEARSNVRLEHALPRGGRRVAVGDIGVVEFTTSGNILRLSADRSVDARRFVTARDHDGLTLRSPEIEIREAQGITRASGPGDLQVPADATGGGMSGVPTRILYGENGSMIYNELALNIRVNDNVRIVQPGAGDNWSYPSLDGICDRMEIILLEPPVVGDSNEDALSRIQRMDAIGQVLLRVYAESSQDNPDQDWLSRPGTTFFTKGDQAQYDVREGQISIDRFVLQTNTSPRRWNFEGQLDSATIREGEPFDFSD